MFLLNVLLDLTDELDVFCRSFATQNTSASLYSILTYQIKLASPHPAINLFEYAKCYIDVHFFYFKPSLQVLSKNYLAFWCCLINLPIF